jgi:hypothetical protein
MDFPEVVSSSRGELGMRYKVTREHRSNYPNPITLSKGQTILLGKKYDDPEGWHGWIYCRTTCGTQEGWVPEQMIQAQGNTGLILADYTARELDVGVGQEVLGFRKLNGWVWCEKASGSDAGWVPLDNLKLLA